MLDALSNAQRRTLLAAVLTHDPGDDSPLVVDGETERDVVGDPVAMHHVHLPKLAEYGFVEWDRVDDEVREGPTFDDIRPFLELLDDHRGEHPADWL